VRESPLYHLVAQHVAQLVADADRLSVDPAAPTIAAAHNISLRHLYKVCAEADLSLEQWIIGERLRGAREELSRPESRQRPIAMIARRWGFRDPTHFTRRFRAVYGMAPSEWRTAHSAVKR
jgi:AraC-like DNA-binding protein